MSIWFFENLLKYREIYHFLSTRIGGFSKPPYDSLNLGFNVGDSPEVVFKNRQRLASVLAIPLKNFTTAKQIHEGKVKIITEELRGRGAVDYETAVNGTDAMVTNVPNIYLMVLVADCVPILFFDPRKKVIGVAHAGWRETVRSIAKNVIRTFQERFNCSPKDIIVGIGVSIGPCCYEVGSEVLAQLENIFHRKKGYISNGTLNGKAYFNLWEANKIELLQMGVPEKNIEIARICTYCNYNLFFSERYQKGKTGRFGVGIMLKEV